MNILSIAPYTLFPVNSGGRSGIVYLNDGLGRLCNLYTLTTKDTAIPSPEYHFTVLPSFPKSAVRYLPFVNFFIIKHAIRKYRIDAIVCNHPYMMPGAYWAAKVFGIPVFQRSHNIESERFKTIGKKWWPLMKWYEQKSMHWADGVFFISEEDIEWAERNYAVAPSKSFLIPFGTNIEAAPPPDDTLKIKLADQLKINPHKKWIYFLGVLDYYPNEQAVLNILHHVVPRISHAGDEYELIIAGKGLSADIIREISTVENVHYTGFIDKLDDFLMACDVMLNPLLLGGGVKTKLIEALAYNNSVVSFDAAAIGVEQQLCGGKLLTVKDHDWDAFAATIISTLGAETKTQTPDSFYKNYYWGSIAQKAVGILKSFRKSHSG
ncbi:MAG TPA: glycosyltransferase family 4 protein [Chitinophagaceae bacterium]|nr:glycosyltransferase family 4 protein [Chitinophagaceae bacterium]